MINSLIKKMKKHKNIICFIGLLLLVFFLLKNFKLLEGLEGENLTQDKKQNLKKAEHAVEKNGDVIININTDGDTPKGDKERDLPKSATTSPAPISDT